MSSSQSLLRLWYEEPARKWANAVPIGNGRFGAMIWGQVEKERWQLNEDSVWYGGPQDRIPKDALKYLPRLRNLLNEGELAEAEKLVMRAFVAMPESQRHYESLGLVNLIFPHNERDVTNYKRWLDLETATAGVSYEHDGVVFKREVFASFPADAIVAKFTSSQRGTVTFDLRIIRQAGMPIQDRSLDAREMDPEGVDTNIYMDSVEVMDDMLVMRAKTGGGGVDLCLVAAVSTTGGTVEMIGETCVVHHADSATLILASETTFRHPNPLSTCVATIQEAKRHSFTELHRMHAEDYGNLFSRFRFNLGDTAVRQSGQSIPTDRLMRQARLETPHPWLITLYCLYGRYLLIASSRPAFKALPANLQGIWNERMAPTWGSKFTINVNTEMNYWHAGSTGLSECELPLFSLMERLAVNGAKVARQMYGCGGWCAHHNTDLWADASPHDRVIQATLWPMGGAWLCTHILPYYDFTGDEETLKRMFPVLKGSVEFYLDFLIDKDGYKVTSPSLSPENRYRLPNQEEGTMCIAPTMDSSILFRLFSDFAAAANVLHVRDEGLQQKVTEFRDKLPPLRIGRYGQLQEWSEDYEECEPGHRHVSHLWGLYPGEQITRSDPAFINACKATLARRAAHGGGHTGWSRAWMIALWARLGDGNEAINQVQMILKTSTHDSLLDDHPPFQIDGNFGATAGIVEMLMQSHGKRIVLLPALPNAWRDGSVCGIRARGGFVVDIEWAGGVLEACTIRSSLGGACSVEWRRDIIVKHRGQTVGNGTKVFFTTLKGEEYSIRPIT